MYDKLRDPIKPTKNQWIQKQKDVGKSENIDQTDIKNQISYAFENDARSYDIKRLDQYNPENNLLELFNGMIFNPEKTRKLK